MVSALAAKSRGEDVQLLLPLFSAAVASACLAVLGYGLALAPEPEAGSRYVCFWRWWGCRWGWAQEELSFNWRAASRLERELERNGRNNAAAETRHVHVRGRWC